MLNTVVLFMKLANLKKLLYQKVLYLKIVGIYKKYCLNLQSIQGSFFYFICFSIYKMVDSEFSMEIYKNKYWSSNEKFRNVKICS